MSGLALKVSCGYDGHPDANQLLVDKGAALRVNIGFDKSWTPNPKAPPKSTRDGIPALIDTGASQSFIDVDLARELKLLLFDEGEVIGVHGPGPASYYTAQVHFPALKFTVRGQFAALPIRENYGYDLLIGRTFLRHFRMEYDGVTGAVTVYKEGKLGQLYYSP